MYQLNRFVVIISQLILLIDNTKQSKFKLGLAAFKAIGKSVKNPMVKKVGDTIKKSMSMLQKNKNTLKNLACNLEKKVLTATHKFGSRPVKYLGEVGIKHTVPQMSRQGQKSIQMRSAAQISGKAKGFMPMAKGHLKGNELMSFVSAITKSKPFAPFLLAAGGLGTLQMNLVTTVDSDIDDAKVDAQVDGLLNSQKGMQAEKSDGVGSVDLKSGDKKQPKEKVDQPLVNEVLENEIKLDYSIDKVQHYQSKLYQEMNVEEFDATYCDEIRNINHDYNLKKEARWKEFKETDKKLSKDFEQENIALNRAFDLNNKKTQRNQKKKKQEFAKIMVGRRSEFNGKMKVREEEQKAKKIELNHKFHETTKEFTDEIGVTNKKFVTAFQKYNSDYRDKNGVQMKWLINKSKTLNDEIAVMEAKRVEPFNKKYRYTTDSLKTQLASDKAVMQQDHISYKKGLKIMAKEVEELDKSYKKKNEEAKEEFEKLNKESFKKFKEENKKILEEQADLKMEVKKMNHGPFKEFIDLNQARMEAIMKKYIDPETKKPTGVKLFKEEIALKDDYELYSYIFPVKEKPPPTPNRPDKNFMKRKK